MSDFHAVVPYLPTCDFPGCENTAHYDARLNFFGRVTWGYACGPHFRKNGGKLGVGLGQRLVVKHDS